MSNPCIIESCNKPIFAKKYCLSHQYLRTDRKPLKPSKIPLRKQSKAFLANIPKKKEELTRQWEFFLKIWSERPHICNSCGCFLGNEARSFMFDHLAEKELYPALKFKEWNILLVCLTCHNNRHQGIITSLYKAMIDIAKQRVLYEK